MISSSLSRKMPATAVLLTLVTASSFDKWKAQQSEAAQNWLEANGFKAQAGRFALIPDHTGCLSRVVVAASEPLSTWDLAGLPSRLPAGSYVLDNIKKPADEEKLALGWLLGSYNFNLHKKHEMSATTLYLSTKTDLKRIAQKAEAIAHARDMITTPAEEMGPKELADAVVKIGKEYGAKVTQIIGDDLLKQNYPAIHAVGRASHRKPRLIDLTWGNPKHPLVTLIGKGVCFDTGGLDLKPSSSMQLMRKDMGGAAVALGVATLVMQRKMRVRLRLLIPAVDNSINDVAYRPTDVITMRNGLRVEVSNTDAEGRMILADAISEAASEKPDLLIDFATLGPARGIFGGEMGTFFTNNDALARDLGKLAHEAEDYVWRMPVHPPYDTMLASPFADLVSSPGLPGGAMIAAAFLNRFVGETPTYVHIDFMGWNSSSKAGRPQGGEAMTLRAAYALLQKRYASK